AKLAAGPKLRTVVVQQREDAVKPSSAAARGEIAGLLKPALSSGLQVERLRPIRDNAVAVTVPVDQWETVKSRLEKGGLRTKEAAKVLPRIKIMHVSREMSSEEVVSALKRQNTAISDEDAPKVAISHKFGPTTGPTVHYAVSMPAASYKRFLEQKRAYVGLDCCYVDHFVPASRCGKCLAYGHSAARCYHASRCLHCADEGHDLASCPRRDDPPRCGACHQKKLSANHRSDDAHCPEKIRAVHVAMLRVDFS
ncbi:MAG: hypothetical protein ACRCSX_08945, partial [Allorhizobium sp.]